MTNRLVDPLLLGRPLAFEWPQDNDRIREGGGSRKRRASSVSALLVMLVAALVMVPVALADDDDDNGNGNGCVNAPPSLVSWWPGDGHFMDIADGNHGAPVGGATADLPGMVDRAFTLDGIDDAVRALESGSNLDGFPALTLDAWVRSTRLLNPPDTLQAIVTKYDSRTADGVSYYLTQVDGGFLRLAVFDTVSPAAFALYTSNVPVVLADGVFRHVAGVWGGGFTPANFHLYVNGAEVPGTLVLTDAPLNMADNATPVNIGRFESSSFSVVSPFGHFQGQIDEVEIFNRALTQAEIASIAGAGPAGKCKPGQGGGPGDDDGDDDDGDDDDGDDDDGDDDDGGDDG